MVQLTLLKTLPRLLEPTRLWAPEIFHRIFRFLEIAGRDIKRLEIRNLAINSDQINLAQLFKLLPALGKISFVDVYLVSEERVVLPINRNASES